MTKTNRVLFFLISGVIFCLTLATYSCKSIDSDPKLTGADRISDSTIKEVIQLEVSHMSKTLRPNHCSGFIVSHNTVLTVANCLYDVKEITTTRPDTHEVIKTNKYKIHPKCKKECHDAYDIGVVVFDDSSFEISSTYMIDTTTPRSKKTVLKLTSYGRTTIFRNAFINYDPEDSSFYKQPGNTNITKSDLCGRGMIQAGSDESVFSIEEQAPDNNSVVANLSDAGGIAILESDHTRVVGIISHGIENKSYKYIGLKMADKKIETVKRASCIVDFSNKAVLNFLKDTKSEFKIGMFGIN